MNLEIHDDAFEFLNYSKENLDNEMPSLNNLETSVQTIEPPAMTFNLPIH